MRDISDSLKEGGEVLIETNVAYIGDHEKEIKNNFVPIILKRGESSVSIKNAAIDFGQYLESFEEAGLKIEIEKEYPSEEVNIDQNYEYKDAVTFKTLIIKLIKGKYPKLRK
ncbi:MAG: hypothetical protein HGB08_02875 [Candidatus Moranbacteria bacterium]|nr:hypothetical protein [Candidatus Moranbacteria bacterium]